jgi:hypothetical protein
MVHKKQYHAPQTATTGLYIETLLLGTSSDSLPINKDDEPVNDPGNVYSRKNWGGWDDEAIEEE